MNARTIWALVLTLGLGWGVVIAAQDNQGGLESLRGKDIASPSVDSEIQRWQEDKEPIKRAFIQQPPLIPHSIDGYKVNIKFNKCLTCHSWANYKKARATKVSQTHFEDRDGSVLANVSARRYFCTQCHVPQADAKPLVENDFKPLEAISGR